MKLERKFSGGELKAVEDETGTIEGYASVFGVTDSYGDVMVKGAFAGSLSESRKVRMLWQHNAAEPIGQWTQLGEDDTGLFVKGRINQKTSWGRDAYEAIKSGDVEGLSVGFVTRERDWSDDGETRFLRKVDLWEVSAVTFPANAAANMTGIKAFGDLAEIDALDVVGLERSLRAVGLSREEAKRVLHRHAELVLKARADELQQEQAHDELQKLMASLRA